MPEGFVPRYAQTFGYMGLFFFNLMLKSRGLLCSHLGSFILRYPQAG